MDIRGDNYYKLTNLEQQSTDMAEIQISVDDLHNDKKTALTVEKTTTIDNTNLKDVSLDSDTEHKSDNGDNTFDNVNDKSNIKTNTLKILRIIEMKNTKQLDNHNYVRNTIFYRKMMLSIEQVIFLFTYIVLAYTTYTTNNSNYLFIIAITLSYIIAMVINLSTLFGKITNMNLINKYIETELRKYMREELFINISIRITKDKKYDEKLTVENYTKRLEDLYEYLNDNLDDPDYFNLFGTRFICYSLYSAQQLYIANKLTHIYGTMDNMEEINNIYSNFENNIMERINNKINKIITSFNNGTLSNLIEKDEYTFYSYNIKYSDDSDYTLVDKIWGFISTFILLRDFEEKDFVFVEGRNSFWVQH